MSTFIDVGEEITSGLKTAYDATMKAVCTETGQFLTENLAGLGTTVVSGGNAYVGLGSALIVDKALEYQCSQRRSSYGTHQDAVLKAGCTSEGKFTASSVTGLFVNYKSPKNAFKVLYEYGGSLFAGEFLEKSCDVLSTDPNAQVIPPPPFRTPAPTPKPTSTPTPQPTATPTPTPTPQPTATPTPTPMPQPTPTPTPKPVELKLKSASCSGSGGSWTISVAWQGGGAANKVTATVENIGRASGHYAEKTGLTNNSTKFIVPESGQYLIVVLLTESGKAATPVFATC